MELKIKLCLLVVLICAVFSAGDESEDENDDDPFVPTHDWQVVQKGKKVPKGLHIRINLETGITEAKLLNDKEEKENNGKTALTIAVQENAEDSNAESKLSQLKEALKNVENDYNTQNEEVLKRIDKFKSYEELKKDLNELNLSPKADAEILKELLEKHIELTTQKNYDEDIYAILLVLEDLEYLIHQYDNAKEFVSLNGFSKIIYKNLNSTSKEIKRQTLKLLGSCLQNNVKVKIHALETGTLDILLRLLVLEDDLTLKHRGCFALSALLRGFPYAQLKFVQNAGVSVLSKLFESKDLKLHVRLVTLISDLLQEELSVRSNTQEQDYFSALQQYDEIKLKELLIEQGYCKNLNDLLMEYAAIDPGDHDVVEKILNAFTYAVDDCASKPTPNKIIDLLVSLKSMYEKLASKQNEAGESQYFTSLHNVTDQLVKKFLKNVKSEL